MKKFLKILSAIMFAAGAALLLKLSAEVMGSCSHRYIDVSEGTGEM